MEIKSKDESGEEKQKKENKKLDHKAGAQTVKP